ncbi:MAG: endolytic transglycosylase MltG [Eubacterium sp.]|jgi:Predicted periplasmic solute-binding protein|nr:endolytic transglycosylase MltG [Eubacterium sp.]
MKARKLVSRIVGLSVGILVMVLVIFGIYYLAQKAYSFGYRVYTEEPIEKEPGTDVLVEVTKGMDGRQIGELLLKKGLIRDAGLFAVQLKLSAYADDIKPGTYLLNTSMTAEEMCGNMASGQEEEEESENP